MKTIWKYILEIMDVQYVEIPAGAEIIHVAEQGGHLCIWAVVDKSKAFADRRKIVIVGTGNDFVRRGLVHLGTAQVGKFVWHVFEELP